VGGGGVIVGLGSGSGSGIATTTIGPMVRAAFSGRAGGSAWRWTLLLASAGAALLVARAVWRLREPSEHIEVHADRAKLDALLRARMGTPAGVPATSSGLLLEPVDEATAPAVFWALDKRRYRYDPNAYYLRRGPAVWRKDWAEHPDGGWEARTNRLGMREDADPAPERPDLRILVAGDSHTDGVCPNADSFTNLLEARLAARWPERSVEALNAGLGGYSTYNYLGTLDAYAELEPHVFVVVVYGGNDFMESMRLQRYFQRRPPPEPGPYAAKMLFEEHPAARIILSQELAQAFYFLNNPDDVQASIDVTAAILVEASERCAARGVRFLCAYLPPPGRAQGSLYEPALLPVLEAHGQGRAALAVSDAIADGWIAIARERGIACVDLRPAFAASEKPCYWQLDHHIDLEGQRVVADALEAALLEMLEEGG